MLGVEAPAVIGKVEELQSTGSDNSELRSDLVFIVWRLQESALPKNISRRLSILLLLYETTREIPDLQSNLQVWCILRKRVRFVYVIKQDERSLAFVDNHRLDVGGVIYLIPDNLYTCFMS